MKNLFFLFILSFSFQNFIAQTNTVGLLKSDINSEEGYTLFSPEKSAKTFLINNCGEKINEWEFTERPGLTVYILENGNILRAGRDSLEIRDWENNLIWSYAMDLNGYNQHHDIEPLPNGNILCLIFDFYTEDTIVSMGRDSLITQDDFKLDKIIELQPIGTHDANLVWEWAFIDHFIQDTDPSKPNFGVISDHPELLDINNDNGQLKDYTHGNGMDYNEDLDQIILSARHTNEIYIIDHSTTTAEAKGHTGGNAGKGGDFLWRWGNPQMYGQTGAQKLFFQHDCKWIPNGYMDEGKISVYNNGGNGSNSFSSIHIIDPPLNGLNYNMTGNEFLPDNYFWTWSGDFLGRTMNEGKKSGCHLLKNGNALICETALGQISEVDRDGNHLWTYKNPVGLNASIYNQFDSVLDGGNTIFRAERYPIDYIGFTGKDLTPQGIIENENDLLSACKVLSINTINESFDINITNPISNNIIHFSKKLEDFNIEVLNIEGKIIIQKENFTGNSLNLSTDLNSGIYFIRLEKNALNESLKVFVY